MVVAGVVVVVLVEDGVVVVVDVDVLVVVDGVVVVEVVVVDDEVLGVVEAVAQSRWARTPTVLAPWRRFVRSVGLTEAGRFVTWSAKDTTARVASAHCPDSTADATESSWLFRLDDWLPESRPAPPPQATRNETAKPSPPASRARGA